MKVSIVTVCFNADKYIEKTIQSVVSQDYNNFEYIIIDGGSCDRTIEIIKKYESLPFLRWISEPDQGIADAMNKGVALATGDIIANINADDYYPNSSIITHVVGCFLEHPRHVWVTGGFDFVNEYGCLIRSIKVRRYSYKRLMRGNVILHPSTFIRTDVVRRVGGFNSSLKYCMDYDLFLKIGEISPPVCIDKQLACFRVHQGSRSVMDSKKAYAEEYFVRCQFFKTRNKSLMLYRIDYFFKKYFNSLLYRKLITDSHKGVKC